jgi:hypothetical protein
MTLSKAILLTAFLSFSASCSSNTSPTPTPAPTSSIPGLGTTYTQSHTIDGTNLADQFDFAVVTSSHAQYGKQNVIGIVQTTPVIVEDTTWLSFDGSDIWRFPYPLTDKTDWFLLPFSSSAGVTKTVDDGTTTSVISSTYEGTGSITIKSTPTDVRKVKVTKIETFDGTQTRDTVVQHWSFAPSLGLILRIDQDAYNAGGQLQSGEHWSILTFDRK